jgi:hypothetical protein
MLGFAPLNPTDSAPQSSRNNYCIDTQIPENISSGYLIVIPAGFWRESRPAQ